MGFFRFVGFFRHPAFSNRNFVSQGHGLPGPLVRQGHSKLCPYN